MKISDNVYLLKSSRGCNCYVVQAKEMVLIDTGLPTRGKGILREIDSLNIKLKHILLTHHDIGAIGNAAKLEDLTGAQVWASGDDIPYILRERDRHGPKKFLKYLLKVPRPVNIKSLPLRISGIQVIPTPGHTPGHVCFLYEEILFVGDLLENKKGTLRPCASAWNWNNQLIMQSVRKLAEHPFRWICPGHGRPLDFSPPRQAEFKLSRL